MNEKDREILAKYAFDPEDGIDWSAKTTDAIGKKCATVGCIKTEKISYEKPLCWKHWKVFDNSDLIECERCHWFINAWDTYRAYDYGADEELEDPFPNMDICTDCGDRDITNEPLAPVYAHGEVKKRLRYLYILKLDGGKWYVGQTNSLQSRLGEHKDGGTVSTRGKNPKLVWFRKWVGNYDGLIEEEDALTRLAVQNPRAIRRRVLNWQNSFKSTMRLVDWNP